MAAMTKQALADLVGQLVKDCESYRDALSIDRIRAMEYYDGVMKDVPSDANRSKVVSRDVRAAVKKVLPSLIRTVLGNDKVVEYQPVNQGDEAGAEQATDYINYIVFPESDGYDAVQDAAHDALKGVGNAGSIQTSLGNAGDITRSYETNFDTKRYEDALMSRMNPQLERDRAALETQLANQGLQPGSEAYNRAIDQASRQANDARFTGALMASTATFTGNQIEIQGVAPRIRLSDTSAGQHDYWLYADGNNFYVLGDRNDDGTWETPHPLALNSSSNTGQLFGSDFWTTANFNPAAKADLAGAAFSGSVSAPSFTSSGNMNIDGSSLYIRGAGNRHVWFASNTGVNRALMYHEQATDKLVWNLYDAAGAHTRSMEYRRSDGALNVQGFISTNGHVAVGGSTLYADGNIYMTRYGTYLSAILDSKITAEGRSYPRRIGGGDLNFNWSGQGGQPSWLWGGNDGSNMYVYNPSNFNVNYANGAGNADTVDGYHENQLAKVNHQGDGNASNYPIGNLLIARGPASAPIARNATVNLGTYPGDSMQWALQGFGITAVNLAGTWRCLGLAWGENNVHIYLFQRVA